MRIDTDAFDGAGFLRSDVGAWRPEWLQVREIADADATSASEVSDPEWLAYLAQTGAEPVPSRECPPPERGAIRLLAPERVPIRGHREQAEFDSYLEQWSLEASLPPPHEDWAWLYEQEEAEGKRA